jgi:hypothetical protein
MKRTCNDSTFINPNHLTLPNTAITTTEESPPSQLIPLDILFPTLIQNILPSKIDIPHPYYSDDEFILSIDKAELLCCLRTASAVICLNKEIYNHIRKSSNIYQYGCFIQQMCKKARLYDRFSSYDFCDDDVVEKWDADMIQTVNERVNNLVWYIKSKFLDIILYGPINWPKIMEKQLEYGLDFSFYPELVKAQGLRSIITIHMMNKTS